MTSSEIGVRARLWVTGTAAAAALAVPASAVAATPSSGGAGAKPISTGLETSVSPSRFLSGGRDRVALSFRVRGITSKVTLAIRLVRRSGGTVVRSWTRTIDDSSWHIVRWGGSSHGKLQPDGGYAFRVTAEASDGTVIRSAGGSSGHNRFTMHNFVFPLRGSHSYGDGFGAPRSGHTHQGQDVMASCGTAIVAARGGVVRKNAYHSAAGNYVVVSAQGTGEDFVYMHLRKRSKRREGEHVYTGQQIGSVGQTGDATACHLHFEMWSAPGWYAGGSPFDPTPSLRAWDRYS